MSLGNRLVELRKELGLTQTELSRKLGISRGSLSMYEIDKREPDNNTLNNIANFFNVSTDYLLGRSNIRNSNSLKNENSTAEAKVDSEQEQFADDLIQILIDSGEIKEGEILTEEKRERLLNLIRKAIEISRL